MNEIELKQARKEYRTSVKNNDKREEIKKEIAD